MGQMASSRRWYVAETVPRKEQFAVENLARQSFRSLFLRFRKTRRHARRVDEILAPLFPGYVFVQFDESRDNWSAINGTFGVKRLIGARGKRPEAIPEGVIRTLFARCEGGIVKSARHDLKVGQAVQIVNGPFADQWATIERLPETGRVRVLLNVLGKSTCTTLSIGVLAPV